MGDGLLPDLLFDLSFEVLFVLRGVLVVSCPTVVGPLVSFICLSKMVMVVSEPGEGTLADPIGAMLCVVVLIAVVAGTVKAWEEIVHFLL